MRRRCKRRWLCAALWLGCLAAAPRAARAWGTAEHQEIGAAAYREACVRVAATIGAAADAPGPVHDRFALACGRNVEVLARIYGDATAIAGDYVGHPDELMSPQGAWRFSSPKHYYLLALENSSHFNPMAQDSWRDYHQDAVNHALSAAPLEGLPRSEAIESAVRENAFADHSLQDSFAAGHMGFNRRASSAGAAKIFHDVWNRRGRTVSDRRGDTWTTYGDGRLDTPANEQGRRHVIETATLSVQDVLLTFVLGRRDPEGGMAVWRSLPFAIDAPELLVDVESLFEGHSAAPRTSLTPLVAAVVPARKNTVVNSRVWAAAPFSNEEPTVAWTADVELAIPVLPAQAVLGAGGTLRQPGGGHSAVAEFGLLAPLGLSIDGLWSHEVEAAASLIFLRDVATVIRAEYHGNLELGTSLITLHLGLSEFLPERETGWFVGLGYGIALSAAGGGSF